MYKTVHFPLQEDVSHQKDYFSKYHFAALMHEYPKYSI